MSLSLGLEMQEQPDASQLLLCCSIIQTLCEAVKPI